MFVVCTNDSVTLNKHPMQLILPVANNGQLNNQMLKDPNVRGRRGDSDAVKWSKIRTIPSVSFTLTVPP